MSRGDGSSVTDRGELTKFWGGWGIRLRKPAGTKSGHWVGPTATVTYGQPGWGMLPRLLLGRTSHLFPHLCIKIWRGGFCQWRQGHWPHHSAAKGFHGRRGTAGPPTPWEMRIRLQVRQELGSWQHAPPRKAKRNVHNMYRHLIP